MSRVLLVTNDFPPRRGGIQSYLARTGRPSGRGRAHTLTVYAPNWKGADDFTTARGHRLPVVRHPGTLMLPVPAVAAGCDS